LTLERGDIWLAGLDPVLPGEQGGTRPVVIVSGDAFNAWPVGLVVVVPVTTRDRGFSHHVAIVGGGLDRPSFVMPEYVRSISQRRLRHRMGRTELLTMGAVDEWLRRINSL
jgi:mRNA interferase MazF